MPIFPPAAFFSMAALAGAGMVAISVSSSTTSSLPLVSTLKSRCLPLSMVSTSYWVTPFSVSFEMFLISPPLRVSCTVFCTAGGRAFNCRFAAPAAKADRPRTADAIFIRFIGISCRQIVTSAPENSMKGSCLCQEDAKAGAGAGLAGYFNGGSVTVCNGLGNRQA